MSVRIADGAVQRLESEPRHSLGFQAPLGEQRAFDPVKLAERESAIKAFHVVSLQRKKARKSKDSH